MSETIYGFHPDDLPDWEQMLRDYRLGRFKPQPAQPSRPEASGGSLLCVLLERLHPGGTARAATLRKVEGDWTDVSLIGWVADPIQDPPPTFQLEFPRSRVQTVPLPITATAPELLQLLKNSPDPWPSTVTDVRLGEIHGVQLYRWRIGCVPERADPQVHQRQPYTTLKPAYPEPDPNFRVVVQRNPWIETGTVVTVSSALPCGEPAAFGPGTVVACRVFGNAGWVVTEVEVRELRFGTEGVYPYQYY